MDGSGTSTRQLRILGIQDRGPFAYNSPRLSQHVIERRRFLPLDKIYRPMAGGAMIRPWPPAAFDLVHAWSRIPLGPTSFVVGFEWHLPISWERQPKSFKILMDQLLSPKCRRIVAMSKGAASATLHRHEAHPDIEELRAKTTVRLPNVDIPEMQEWFDPGAKLEQLRLLFVGDQFARKGGCVAVKLAEKANAAGLPIHITIVSALECGQGVWSDPMRAEFFRPYLNLLDQPNVTVLPPQPNARVMELIDKSHLTLLPTLADRFDYTVAEGMARFAPAIVTASTSFPEFVDHDNGVLLSLDVGCQGDWRPVERADRDTPDFEKMYAGTIEQLADQAFAACVDLFNNPKKLAAKRRAARRTAEEKFDALEASRFWDQLYLDAVSSR